MLSLGASVRQDYSSLSISVPGPSGNSNQPKRQRKSGEEYVVYAIVCRGRGGATTVTWRRYTEFRSFMLEMAQHVPSAGLPPPPAKTWFGKYDAKLLFKRSAAFQQVLRIAAKCPLLAVGGPAKILFGRFTGAAQCLRRDAAIEKVGVLLSSQTQMYRGVCFRVLLRFREERRRRRRRAAELQDRTVKQWALSRVRAWRLYCDQRRSDRRRRRDTAARGAEEAEASELRSRSAIAAEERQLWHSAVEVAWATKDVPGMIGMTVRQDRTEMGDSCVTITQVAAGSPADAAGVKAGDRIVWIVSSVTSKKRMDRSTATYVVGEIVGAVRSAAESVGELYQDRVMEALTLVNTNRQWHDVRSEYKATHGGDISAMIREAGAGLYSRVDATLRRHGVLIDGDLMDDGAAAFYPTSWQDFKDCIGPPFGVFAGSVVTICHEHPRTGRRSTAEVRLTANPAAAIRKEEKHMEWLSRHTESAMYKDVNVSACAALLADPQQLYRALEEGCMRERAASGTAGSAGVDPEVTLREFMQVLTSLFKDGMGCWGFVDGVGEDGPIPKEEMPRLYRAAQRKLFVAEARALAAALQAPSVKLVLQVLRCVKTRGDWSALQLTFRRRCPSSAGGDLKAALAARLAPGDMARVRSALPASCFADDPAETDRPARLTHLFPEVRSTLLAAMDDAMRYTCPGGFQAEDLGARSYRSRENSRNNSFQDLSVLAGSPPRSPSGTMRDILAAKLRGLAEAAPRSWSSPPASPMQHAPRRERFSAAPPAPKQQQQQSQRQRKPHAQSATQA